MLVSNEKLGSLLVKSELVTQADWDAVVKNALRRRRSVEDVLVERGMISLQFLYELIAEELKVSLVDFKRVVIDKAVFGGTSEEVVTKYEAIPFKKEDKKTIAVAFVNPTDKEAVAAMERELKGKITPYLTTKKSFIFGLRAFQRDLSGELDEILAPFQVTSTKSDKKTPAQVEYPIVKIVDTILAYAVMLNASDVHFEPLADALLIRMRIDGLLHDKLELPKDVMEAVVARVKILAHAKIDEHLAPQDGRFVFLADDEDVFVRVSIIPTFFGEKVVMRILNEHEQRFNLEESGLNAYNLEIVGREIQRSHGLILVVGPTGSGKTTTLYTLLNMLNTEEVNICTIEDPIEYGIARINQTQVNVQSGYTFASGLRALLRKYPVVILVGEVRDEATAETAIHSSLTGHLVLSTLHTDNTVSVVSRLVDMNIKPCVLASTLNMIIAQRLVRRICIDCIESYQLDKSQVASLVDDYDLDVVFLNAKKRGIISTSVKTMQQLTFYRGKGCGRCAGTGYAGRTGFYEVLALNEILRTAIVSGMNIDELERVAIEQGMRTLVDDGWEKVLTGATSLEELFAIING